MWIDAKCPACQHDNLEATALFQCCQFEEQNGVFSSENQTSVKPFHCGVPSCGGTFLPQLCVQVCWRPDGESHFVGSISGTGGATSAADSGGGSDTEATKTSAAGGSQTLRHPFMGPAAMRCTLEQVAERHMTSVARPDMADSGSNDALPCDVEESLWKWTVRGDLRDASPHLYWSMVWHFTRFQLPLPLIDDGCGDADAVPVYEEVVVAETEAQALALARDWAKRMRDSSTTQAPPSFVQNPEVLKSGLLIPESSMPFCVVPQRSNCVWWIEELNEVAKKELTEVFTHLQADSSKRVQKAVECILRVRAKHPSNEKSYTCFHKPLYTLVRSLVAYLSLEEEIPNLETDFKSSFDWLEPNLRDEKKTGDDLPPPHVVAVQSVFGYLQ